VSIRHNISSRATDKEPLVLAEITSTEVRQSLERTSPSERESLKLLRGEGKLELTEATRSKRSWLKEFQKASTPQSSVGPLRRCGSRKVLPHPLLIHHVSMQWDARSTIQEFLAVYVTGTFTDFLKIEIGWKAGSWLPLDDSASIR
jgi:hypothetical protein